MRKYIILTLTILSINCFAKIDLSLADQLYKEAEDFKLCEKELQIQLEKSENGIEKCEVLWRLSRVCLLLGEELQSKEEKRSFYIKGREYATDAIKANPNNPNGYMWHSANAGRESQTKGLKDQIAIVSVVIGDISAIIDKLNVIDMSEAWQALAEMYYKHPFKSNDAAINYGRKAIMCIPVDETRLSSYTFFAEMLYNRNDSSSKRKSNINQYVEDFQKDYKSNIDKFCYFEGSLGNSYIPKWSSKALADMSDKEEAIDIINYAINLYLKKTSKTPTDNNDYRILMNYKAKWK